MICLCYDCRRGDFCEEKSSHNHYYCVCHYQHSLSHFYSNRHIRKQTICRKHYPLIKNAETFIELDQIDKAEEIYAQLVKEYPNDWIGWAGNAYIQLLHFPCSFSSTDIYEFIGCTPNIPNRPFYEISNPYTRMFYEFVGRFTSDYKYSYQNYSYEIKEISKDCISYEVTYYSTMPYDNAPKNGYASPRFHSGVKLDDIILMLKWLNENKCCSCGGDFKGIFKKVCSKCGKPKDY